MRGVYPSDCYAAGKERRLRRLAKVASPRLWQAYREGRLSLRATEAVSRKLGSPAQDRWLQKELERRARKAQGEHLAATVIMDLLLGTGRIDLAKITETIRDRIHSARQITQAS